MTWRTLLQTILRLIRWRASRPAGGTPAAPTRQHVRTSPELAELEARAARLQARAASGSKGCVAARRELSHVRHAILRAALCAPAATTP